MCIRDRVTPNHLLVTDTERQNVCKAAELLSSPVAAAIGYLLLGLGHIVKFL